MPPPEFKKGFTFVHSFKKGKPEHIHVILTDPVIDKKDNKKKVIMVNFSSVEGKGAGKKKKRRKIDPTCIFKGDEHPTLNRESYIVYERAKLMTMERLETKHKREIL